MHYIKFKETHASRYKNLWRLNIRISKIWGLKVPPDACAACLFGFQIGYSNEYTHVHIVLMIKLLP